MNIYFFGMIISMILYVVIGMIVSKKVKNVNDFFVAGRNAPTFLIVGSLVASYCSTGLFMGDAGEAYAGFWSPFMITAIMLSCGYLLGSVFFGKYLRRSNVLTIPEFFGKRFQSEEIRKLAAVTAVVTMVVYMLSVMQGIGTLMNYVTGINYNICVLLALITFSVLCFVSGSKGVLVTDTLMFSIFTISALIAVVVIIGKLGGWTETVVEVTVKYPDLFSWHGDLGHLYPIGVENMIWALITGLTWVCVCGLAPWQASRYLMAKNEHVVVRSSVYAAIGVGTLEFVIPTTAALLTKYSNKIPDSTHVMIWSAMNMLPTILGVIVLTGVLAAGISSATTFLSLIGSSVANDIFNIEEDDKKLRVSRISIVIVSIIVMLLAYFNPPQIYIIMLLGATVVTCSWAPVCIASIWSKNVTRGGAFWGMFSGFVVCSGVKILSAITGVSIPIYFDAFFLGIFANILVMVIVSKCTKITKEEMEQRRLLMITPESEFDAAEIKKTKRTVRIFFVYGFIVILAMWILWAKPYHEGLRMIR